MMSLLLVFFGREGLEESLKGELAFASAMEAFGGNADDPIGVAVGGMPPSFSFEQWE